MKFSELIIWVRNALDDLGVTKTAPDGTSVTEYKYTDDRLAVLLVLSMRKVFNDLGVSEEARPRMSVDPPYILDPPLCEFEVEDWFAELVVLKSGCTMETGDLKKSLKYSGVTAKLGKTELHTGNSAYSRLNPEIYKLTSPCSEYNNKLEELKLWTASKNAVVWRKFVPVSCSEHCGRSSITQP